MNITAKIVPESLRMNVADKHFGICQLSINPQHPHPSSENPISPLGR